MTERNNKSRADVDAAVAALVGGADMPPRIDPAPEGAPSRSDELQVQPPAPLSPVQAADAVHSTKVPGGKGYRVKVRGLYYAPNPEGKGKIKKSYELFVNVARLSDAGSVIKNKLLLPKLKEAYPDAVRHRTFHIVGAEPLTADTPASDNLAYMTRRQLEDYARQYKVPVDLTTYPQTDKGTTVLRATLIDHRQNPEGFAEREAEKLKTRQEDAELAALNDGLVSSAEGE